MWLPRGGMYSVVEALVEVAREAGVEFSFGQPVSRIITDAGRARGVMLSDGSQVLSDVVLANGRFASPDSRSADRVNTVLGTSAVERSLVDEDRQTVTWRRSQLQGPLPANRGDLENYFTIKLSPGEKASVV